MSDANDTTVAAPAVPAIPLDVAVDRYIKLRDKMDAVKKANTEALKPYVEMLSRLEGVFLAALNEHGVDAMRSPLGTFYKVTHTRVSVTEWTKTLKHIQEHGLWELLEARVSKLAAQAVMEETGEAIPGVAVTRTVEVQVRRA